MKKKKDQSIFTFSYMNAPEYQNYIPTSHTKLIDLYYTHHHQYVFELSFWLFANFTQK